MKFIEEIVVEEFLPTFRSMLAENLHGRGLTQHEVATALGISQSAVSKYVHGTVTGNQKIREDDRVQQLVERLGEGLATGDMSRVGALVEAEVLIRRLEDGDLLANLHQEAMPELAAHDGGFAVHDPESRLRSREQVRSSVRRGVRTLSNASGFAALIPAVGSNLVECLPDATNIDDVAGVPGRILDVKGRPTVPGEPEFGVSEHVASVLLAARRGGATARAGLNVRYDPDLVDRLTDAGYETIEFRPAGTTDVADTTDSTDPSFGTTSAADPIETALEDRSVGETFVLYHTGAFGIEPIVYVLGPDAPTTVAVVRECL